MPAAWRGADVEASETLYGGSLGEPLPPISEFLVDHDEPSGAGAHVAADAHGSGHAEADGPSFEDYIASTHGDDDGTTRTDDWPFADAGAATVELSGELRAPDIAPATSPQPSASSSHTMWNDDDLLDIMPSPAQLSAEDAPWSPGAGAAAGEVRFDEAAVGPDDLQSSPRKDSEFAARALESLASRVRSGELVLPGYVPEAGDAAALAAALAALLGTRRG